MAERKWRAWAGQLIYRRPYEDAWGVLHDPTTEWDELFKYYQSWVRILVCEGTRRMARPASAGAQELIREKRRHQERNATRINKLEADYLERTTRRKHWKRRQRKKGKARVRAASYSSGAHKGAPSGA
ncbi:hypothetical protein LR021_00210 [Candidatus Bipolaricaulota bacterium]|nr:hypothetical protein [Candidatus Bipolaricaulota bacterium]